MTDPGMHKVLVDNETITATEVTYGPGQKTNSHTHPAAFLYAFTEGSLFVTNGDGTTETFVLKPGDSAYLAPQGPHVTVNNGKKPVKILLIELKSEPYMADKKMK